MSKRDLSKIAITDDNSTFSNDFIKKNTNFNSGKEFCNAIGVYTLEDLVNLKWSPALDEFISKNTKFKTYEEFTIAQLPKYLQDIL